MKLFRSLYFRTRFFQLLAAVVGVYIFGYVYPFLTVVGHVLTAILSAITILDIVILYGPGDGVSAERVCADRFSNGDENPVDIFIENRYTRNIDIELIDEVPYQFQERNMRYTSSLDPGERRRMTYKLRPVKRGEYNFGAVNIFAISEIGLVMRRYRFDADKNVQVYPSFLQLRQYELLAISNNLTLMGVKKIRRIGHNREFEQIEKYVPGDDFRRINWKATARTNTLMVNHYQDEKSQHVYSVIDKGRAMEMPFEGMTLLDYAINASLVISNVAQRKGDRPGLVTFQDRIETMLPASSRQRQMHHIMESLYREKTSFLESDFSRLYLTLRRQLTQRSLVILYTNFESQHSLERQLPYLRMIARRHVVLCVFFRNTELEEILHTEAAGLEDIYTKGIAEQLIYEKRLIARRLLNHGIQPLLTTPQELTINSINKYLELKARGLI